MAARLSLRINPIMYSVERLKLELQLLLTRKGVFPTGYVFIHIYGKEVTFW